MFRLNRGFIKTLWGVYKKERRFKHRLSINDHFDFLKLNPYEQPFIAMVFGEDNYKQLIDLGFNCRLVDKRPVVWDMEKEQFRHKLEALKCGMQIFDEMVYLDWDTQLIKPFPDNFWDVLNEKAPIQASLRQYFQPRIKWREEDKRKVPCAAFIYLRDKTIPDKLIKIWEEIGRPWSEETVLMKYIENLMGGWKGIDEYWKNFEPEFFHLEGGCKIYTDEMLKTKNNIYEHFIGKIIRKELVKRNITTVEDFIPDQEKKEDRKKRIEERLSRQRKRQIRRQKMELQKGNLK